MNICAHCGADATHKVSLLNEKGHTFGQLFTCLQCVDVVAQGQVIVRPKEEAAVLEELRSISGMFKRSETLS